jgi:hypothetical protein
LEPEGPGECGLCGRWFEDLDRLEVHERVEYALLSRAGVIG